MNTVTRVALSIVATTLTACGSSDLASKSAALDKNCDALFATRVQSNLAFCVTCHVPGGIGDVADGEKFMLTTDKNGQLSALRESWERLGRNDKGPSLILTMAAGTANRPHSGGSPWPKGSSKYADMKALLDGFVSGFCANSSPVTNDEPLLGDARGGNYAANFCEGKSDGSVLPPDPRSLVVPGVNAGKAVVFNAYWKDCGNAVPRPATCGELRAQSTLGRFVAQGYGEHGTPILFAGGNPESAGLPAEDYNNLWQIWGLMGRPDNFDQLVAERFGSPLVSTRNPYPLPGEDPNTTDGGSGQLPMSLTQLRNADGSWRGEIGHKVCVYCHNGTLGTEADGEGLGTQFGGAGATGDFTLALYDFAKAGDFLSGAGSGITVATNRGTGAIDFFQLAFVLFSGGDPNLLANEKTVFSQAIGTIKSPPWWNMSSRPQKFHGAVLPTDSSRIDLAAYYDLAASYQGGDPMVWVDQHAGPFQVWAETLAPPRYPGAIDTALAEAGAVIFHAKDLWAVGLDNPAPKPVDGGNGSCASCHGVYSPRFANDPAYLDSPELMGIAARTLPMSVVGTDSMYAEAMQSLRQADGSTSDAIMDIPISSYCGLGNAAHTEDLTPILLAPPLWGTWAAAPYFHNGSVPNILGVLDPAQERPRIWQRVSAPAREDQVGTVVMGYDTDLARAYDHDKLGWKYDELQCGDLGTFPGVDCDLVNPAQSPLLEQVLGTLYAEIAILWNLPRADMVGMTNTQIEWRKIYNTNEYSQGNQGHTFTAVLTDAERRAVLEYLKTL